MLTATAIFRQQTTWQSQATHDSAKIAKRISSLVFDHVNFRDIFINKEDGSLVTYGRRKKTENGREQRQLYCG